MQIWIPLDWSLRQMVWYKKWMANNGICSQDGRTVSLFMTCQMIEAKLTKSNFFHVLLYLTCLNEICMMLKYAAIWVKKCQWLHKSIQKCLLWQLATIFSKLKCPHCICHLNSPSSIFSKQYLKLKSNLRTNARKWFYAPENTAGVIAHCTYI